MLLCTSCGQRNNKWIIHPIDKVPCCPECYDTEEGKENPVKI
jgi:hypothetical protein